MNRTKTILRTYAFGALIVAMIYLLTRSWLTIAGLYHFLTVVPLCLLFTSLDLALGTVQIHGDFAPPGRRGFCIVLYLHGMVVPDIYFPGLVVVVAVAVSCARGRWRGAALAVGLLAIATFTKLRMPSVLPACALGITALAATIWLALRDDEKLSSEPGLPRDARQERQ